MFRSLIVIITVAGMILPAAQSHAEPKNFREAKILLKKRVYHDRNDDGGLYCGCTWNWRGESGGVLNAASCGLDTSVLPQRAARIEYEHIFAMHSAAQHLPCWRNGGRENCQKTDPLFNKIESDMHNLTPVAGSLNAKRSNYRWGIIEGEPRAFGACDFEVDSRQRVAEPPESARGMIARVNLYMADKYNLRLSAQQRKLFEAWHRMYPVTEWEKERDRRISRVMGWGNHYISGQ